MQKPLAVLFTSLSLAFASQPLLASEITLSGDQPTFPIDGVALGMSYDAAVAAVIDAGGTCEDGFITGLDQNHVVELYTSCELAQFHGLTFRTAAFVPGGEMQGAMLTSVPRQVVEVTSRHFFQGDTRLATLTGDVNAEYGSPTGTEEDSENHATEWTYRPSDPAEVEATRMEARKEAECDGTVGNAEVLSCRIELHQLVLEHLAVFEGPWMIVRFGQTDTARLVTKKAFWSGFTFIAAERAAMEKTCAEYRTQTGITHAACH